MTPTGEQLCYTDAYLQAVEARVAAIDTVAEVPLLVLDRTVFYPGGGGQPSDRGLILRAADGRSWTVRGARKVDGEIVHELEPDDGDPPAVGDLVRVDLDWARRLALMRTHTALHALCGVVWRDYGALVTGGNMEPGAGRMDFEFERMSGDLVDAIEASVNTELAAARDVRVNVLPRDEAFAIPDLIRTKVNLLPEGIEEIRTIEIVGLDLQADGGTHVANTQRGRRHPGHRLRVEGPHQQAHPHRARRRLTPARVPRAPGPCDATSMSHNARPGPRTARACPDDVTTLGEQDSHGGSGTEACRRVHRALPGHTRQASPAAARLRSRGSRAVSVKEAKQILREGVALLSEYQTRLAAQDTHGVVMVLQAMDAAGKDGTIRHVMSGVNPQGVQVNSFKVPSSEDLDHDYLWRYQKKLPERGNIGIFNRSYYEEVLVVRVHPQILAGPEAAGQAQGPRDLEASLPRDQRLGALPDRPGLPVRQALPQRQQGGAAAPVPDPYRRARPELEVQPQRRQGTGLLGRLPEGVQRRALEHEHDLGSVVRHPGR